jgi:hypothetical protein
MGETKANQNLKKEDETRVLICIYMYIYIKRSGEGINLTDSKPWIEYDQLKLIFILFLMIFQSSFLFVFFRIEIKFLNGKKFY